MAGYLRLDLFEGPLRQNELFRRRLVALCAALETRTPRDIILASLNHAEAEEELC